MPVNCTPKVLCLTFGVQFKDIKQGEFFYRLFNILQFLEVIDCSLVSGLQVVVTGDLC